MGQHHVCGAGSPLWAPGGEAGSRGWPRASFAAQRPPGGPLPPGELPAREGQLLCKQTPPVFLLFLYLSVSSPPRSEMPPGFAEFLQESGKSNICLNSPNLGHLGGSVVEPLPLAQGVIPGVAGSSPHRAPCREPASPSVSLLLLSVCLMNE